MSTGVRRTVAVAAVLLCALAAPAVAQDFGPPLRDKPKGGFTQTTPTPTATATATASPTPTATVHPRRNGELANTGADPLRLALAGLSLLGFGFCLRLGVGSPCGHPARR